MTHARSRAVETGLPLLAGLFCLVLAFGFLGARGLWDPDEGRYTNVALTMLDSGNWLEPMRNEETGHWTKPPGTYWLIAASVATFGRTPWAARLPTALACLACTLLAGLCARRLAPGSGLTAALAYATMLLPSGAGQLVTTDFPLAATQALAMYGFIEFRFGSPLHRMRWLLLMWCAFAAAFMIKGPPALLPLLAIVALQWLAPGPRLGLGRHALGLAVFASLALPWFIMVALRHQGLAGYFLGAELVDRVATDRFQRNGQWYGWLKVYVPTLVIGTMPWTSSVWRWLRALPASIHGWRVSATRRDQARSLLLVAWIVLPLLVFCLVRSRLPLYLLPLFVPLAVAIAAERHARGRAAPRWHWLLPWAAVLLVLRLASAAIPTHKDASAWADAIRANAGQPVTEGVFVEDMARYGLKLHLGAEVEKVARAPGHQARFNPDYDEALLSELADTEREPGIVFVTRQALWPELETTIAGYGYHARQLGEPYRGRIMFAVRPSHTLMPGGTEPTP